MLVDWTGLWSWVCRFVIGTMMCGTEESGEEEEEGEEKEEEEGEGV